MSTSLLLRAVVFDMTIFLKFIALSEVEFLIQGYFVLFKGNLAMFYGFLNHFGSGNTDEVPFTS